MPLRLLFPIGVQKPEKSTFVKKCKQFSEKGKALRFSFFRQYLLFRQRESVRFSWLQQQLITIPPAQTQLLDHPSPTSLSSLLVNEGQIIGIKNTLCDDYKLFDSTKRVIWGTACEQQHKSVPILYLMVITMKHRKNTKKLWILTIINFDDNLTAICCVFVKWDRGLLSNIQRLLLSEIATWQTFCSKLKTQRRPTIQILWLCK